MSLYFCSANYCTITLVLKLSYFQGLDLVATDIASGLVLVYIEHQNDKTQFRFSTFSPSSHLPPTTIQQQHEQQHEQQQQPVSNQNGANADQSAGVDNPALESENDGALDRTTPHSVQNDNGFIISETIVPSQNAFPLPKGWMNVQSAGHYMKFALATYGWPMYMYSNLFTGACKLWSHCR